MTNKGILFPRLFFLSTALLIADGNWNPTLVVESDNYGNSSIQITGIVRLVGSSRSSELVITSSESQWFIAREERNKLHDLQQMAVTVEGEESIDERKFANGEFAGIRRELRNIKIITIEGNISAPDN